MKFLFQLLLLYVMLGSQADNLYGQCDTNIIFGDSVLYNGEYCNRVIDGLKEGRHYTFAFDEIHSIIHIDSVDFTSSTKTIFAKYQAFFDSASHEVIYQPKRISSANGDTVISNYWIHEVQLAKFGDYKNDRKFGTWYYYYPKGQLWAKVEFENDFPNSIVQILNTDGSLKAEIHPLNNGLLYDCRVDSSGKFNKCDTTRLKNYRVIFH